MIARWQQFSDDEVSLCTSVVGQHFTSSLHETPVDAEFDSGFLSLFDGIKVFDPNDSKLLRSAKKLGRQEK